jgi:glutaminase
VFTLAMALRRDSSGALWSRVLREPSGTAFNSLVQLEVEHGIPRNPFINAGALVVTDRLMEETPDAATAVLRFLTGQTGEPGPFIDEAAAASELCNSSRNLALAHFLKDFGNLRQSAEAVVANYVRQCSIMMTCVELAKAGLFLAQEGRGTSGTVVSPERGETHWVHHADLRHVRRGRRIRLPGRTARKKRRGRRHPGHCPGPLRHLRLESPPGRKRQLPGGQRRAR